MKEYITTQTVDLYTGLIGLTKEQAQVRGQALSEVRKGVYEIIFPVQFKAGELIKLADPDKGTLPKLDLGPREKAKAEAEAKAAKEKADAEEKVEAESGK